MNEEEKKTAEQAKTKEQAEKHAEKEKQAEEKKKEGELALKIVQSLQSFTEILGSLGALQVKSSTGDNWLCASEWVWWG